jgi:hypothetical protein
LDILGDCFDLIEPREWNVDGRLDPHTSAVTRSSWINFLAEKFDLFGSPRFLDINEPGPWPPIGTVTPAIAALLELMLEINSVSVAQIRTVFLRASSNSKLKTGRSAVRG